MNAQETRMNESKQAARLESLGSVVSLATIVVLIIGHKALVRSFGGWIQTPDQIGILVGFTLVVSLPMLLIFYRCRVLRRSLEDIVETESVCRNRSCKRTILDQERCQHCNALQHLSAQQQEIARKCEQLTEKRKRIQKRVPFGSIWVICLLGALLLIAVGISSRSWPDSSWVRWLLMVMMGAPMLITLVGAAVLEIREGRLRRDLAPALSRGEVCRNCYFPIPGEGRCPGCGAEKEAHEQ